jgi:L-lactate dehydrogenase complex protein LldG
MSPPGGAHGSDTQAPDGARGRILARIRGAIEGRDPVSHPGAAPGAAADDDRGESDPVVRFASALEASGGEVVVFDELEDATAWLVGFAAQFEGVASGGEVPRPLRPALAQVPPDEAGLGVSAALSGAAATGTLVLSSREGRAPQLLPPVHLVWVEARTLHVELGAALDAARERAPLPAALALHSGPSKSADIGRILVRGVHGPGRLVAAVTAFAHDDL